MQPPTRKVKEAVEIWRRWPSEIEVDLLNLPAPVDIADWLQGTRDEHGRLKLSSRRLLLILEKGLPDTSQFKTWALRGGDWTPDQDVAGRTHNLVGKHMASYLSAHGVEGMEATYYPVESPLERKERIANSVDPEDVEPDIISSLFG